MDDTQPPTSLLDRSTLRVSDTPDLRSAWETIASRRPPTTRSLWVLFIHPDGGLLEPIGMVGELDATPTKEQADLYVSSCRAILSTMREDSTVAFAVARPGAKRQGSSDVRWARTIDDACRRWGVRTWPVIMLFDGRLKVFDER